MKPFDLERAKAGAPVVFQRHTSHYTRARIICFDAFGQLPIIALVKYTDTETETIHWFDLNGVGNFGTLFMAPAKRAFKVEWEE